MARRRIEVGVDAVLVVMRPWVASHEETQERLSAHLEGELRGREHKRVLRHLALCPICREVVRSLAQTLEGLRSLARQEGLPARPSLAAAVVESVRGGSP